MTTVMSMNYRTFSELHPGVKEIDYYIARRLVQLLGFAEDELLFYTIVACSESVREGHSCLRLTEWQRQNHWFIASSKHVTLSHENLMPEALGYQFPSEEFWDAHLNRLCLSSGEGHPVVYENRRFYLRRFWSFEQDVATAMSKFSQPIECDIEKAVSILNILFSPQTEVDWQKVSVANSLGKQLSVITGGPGTGKTTTVTKLLLALGCVYGIEFSIKLVAPTGKAAQRLTESIASAKHDLTGLDNIDPRFLQAIPDEAMTIHRLLGVIPNQNVFRFNEERRLTVDILLVDEVSMVDIGLMAKLFRALPDNARVILLGDSNQLPSVATGSLLADIAPVPHPGYTANNNRLLQQLTGYQLDSPSEVAADYLSILQKSYRFREGGGIGVCAGHVISGEAEASWKVLLSDNEEASLATETGFSEWVAKMVERYYRSIAKQDSVLQALDLFSSFRILAPTRQGERGVDAINQLINNRIRRWHSILPSIEFYHGCPLLITENDYESELYNGDIGVVWSHEGRLKVAFYESPTSVRWIGLQRLPKHELVYAMTIHKTQGSEFEHVAMALPDHNSRILSRELIYTGITRARSHLEIYSSESIWAYSVNKKVSRNSGLYDKLFTGS